MRNQQNNQDLTVLLLLKDRAKFTKRWIEYTKKINSPFKILIADGGKEEENQEIFSNKEGASGIDSEYIRYPFDKDAITFRQKVADALSRIKTPFVVLASNDDFYFTEGLMKATEFLKNNNDYVSARGEIYSFSIKDRGDVWGKITNIYPLYTYPSVNDDSSLKRAETFSKGFHSIWHEVFRTKNLEHVYKTACQIGITDLELSSHFIYLCIAALGKVHRDRDSLFMLHQSSSGSTGVNVLKESPFDKILEDSWPENFRKLTNTLAGKIAEIDNLPLEKTQDKVAQYYLSNILCQRVVAGYLERKILNKPSTIITLSHIFNKNNPLRKYIKKMYLDSKKQIRELKNKKTIKNSPLQKELKFIEDFLKNAK